MSGPVLLDSTTLSELSRGHANVTARARAHLEEHGRLTIRAVSIFERLCGYRAAILPGKPFEAHLRQFARAPAVARLVSVGPAMARWRSRTRARLPDQACAILLGPEGCGGYDRIAARGSTTTDLGAAARKP